jgi:hypothetical protein
VAKTATVAAVLPVGRAAVLVARRVGSAGAVETAPAHCRKPVQSHLLGAVADRIDMRCINLHWDVNNRVRLDALSWVLIALAAAVPVIHLLFEVKLGEDALKLREIGGIRRAIIRAGYSCCKAPWDCH